MRGEQLLSALCDDLQQGSPPHARGAVSHTRREKSLRGITPACAGSSNSFVVKVDQWRDHPRMRGEQTKKVQSYKGFFVFFYQISFNF